MVDLTKHSMLKPVRLSAKCYDMHFAIYIYIYKELKKN